MNESGDNITNIPTKFSSLITLIPENEQVIYWLTSHNDFLGYFSYINSETSRSCPPFSYIFICCNIFNLPCIYYDYKNNIQKLLLLTENNVILGTIEEPSCCCFQPKIYSQSYTWNNIKFIGSKQEYAKLQKERQQNGSNNWENIFLTEPWDVLIVGKDENNIQRGLWLDYVTYRSIRVDEIKAIKARLKSKKLAEKNNNNNNKNRPDYIHKQTTLESIEEQQSEVSETPHQNEGIEMSQVDIIYEEKETI